MWYNFLYAFLYKLKAQTYIYKENRTRMCIAKKPNKTRLEFELNGFFSKIKSRAQSTNTQFFRIVKKYKVPSDVQEPDEQ